jgi:hypothetical protein
MEEVLESYSSRNGRDHTGFRGFARVSPQGKHGRILYDLKADRLG